MPPVGQSGGSDHFSLSCHYPCLGHNFLSVQVRVQLLFFFFFPRPSTVSVRFSFPPWENDVLVMRRAFYLFDKD